MTDGIDAPPAERSALQNTLTDDCPKCGKPWTGVYMRDKDTIMCLCSRCGGLNLVPTTAAPTGKRFWAVGPMLGSPGHWLCVEVFPNGTHRQLGQPRSTREAAESDGRSSGLPEWQPNKLTTAT